MSFNVITSPRFEKELKALAKKYPSLKQDYSTLVSSLEIDPIQGTSLGNNVYKIRLAIASKGKGKSGGARVISYVILNDKTVVLLSIYNKGEIDSISDTDIKKLVRKYTD